MRASWGGRGRPDITPALEAVRGKWTGLVDLGRWLDVSTLVVFSGFHGIILCCGATIYCLQRPQLLLPRERPSIDKQREKKAVEGWKFSVVLASWCRVAVLVTKLKYFTQENFKPNIQLLHWIMQYDPPVCPAALCCEHYLLPTLRVEFWRQLSQ